MADRNRSLARSRFLPQILVDSAPVLPSQPPGLQVLHEQRSRTIFFAKCFVEVFEYLKPGVETDQVHQFERAHGMIKTKLERFVDVRSRGNPLLQHKKGFVAYHRIDAAGDESWRFF